MHRRNARITSTELVWTQEVGSRQGLELLLNGQNVFNPREIIRALISFRRRRRMQAIQRQAIQQATALKLKDKVRYRFSFNLELLRQLHSPSEERQVRRSC